MLLITTTKGRDRRKNHIEISSTINEKLSKTMAVIYNFVQYFSSDPGNYSISNFW